LNLGLALAGLLLVVVGLVEFSNNIVLEYVTVILGFAIVLIGIRQRGRSTSRPSQAAVFKKSASSVDPYQGSGA
jgi:hypothetical membrane protein